NTEFSITAYPGICAADTFCWGNPRGQVFQWRQTQDGNWRQQQLYGLEPEKWDFRKQRDADIVIIHIGTNDANPHNNVTSEAYVKAYTTLIEDIHKQWPKAQIICMGLWNGFGQQGETWVPGPAFVEEIPRMVANFKRRYRREFVH